MMRRRGGSDVGRPGSIVALVSFRVALIVAAVTFTGVAIFLSAPLLTTSARELVSDIVLVPVAAMIPVCCLRPARRTTGQLRAAWILLGLAGLLWTLGEAGWFVTHTLTASDRSPSFADVFYLAALFPAGGALLLFPPPSLGGRGRVVSLLGCVVAAASVLFVARSLMKGLRVSAEDQSLLADLFYTAYPIIDVLLIALALVAVIRSGNQARTFLLLVGAGVVTFAVADTIYSVRSSMDAFVAGGPADLGWFAGYLLMALAALHPSAVTAPTPSRAASRNSSLTSLLVYVPIVLATLAAAAFPTPDLDLVLVLTGIGIIVAFGVRQGLLAADHDRLNALREEQLSAVRESETRLRRQVLQTERITQSVADGIIVLDAGRRIVMTNGAAPTLLQRAADSLPGALLDDLLLDQGPDRTAPVLTAVTDGSVLDAVDTQFRTAGTAVTAVIAGTAVIVEVTVGPIQELGRTVGTVLVLRDVSARRAVDKLKSEFISVVSHELRTPLTSIRGSLALLDGGVCGALEPAGSRMVTRALQASERLGRLIDDLLDIERLESGALTMEFETCGAARLIEVAEREMRGLAQHREVELVRLGASGQVRADPDRVVQTLTNLISNAVKFSPPGSRITLSAVPVAGRPAGRHVRRGAGSGRGRGRRAGRVLRHRPRSRHPHGPAGGGVRTLHAGRQLRRPSARRHRSGAGDLPQPRPAPRWLDLGHQRGRRRLHLPLRAARRGLDRSPRGTGARRVPRSRRRERCPRRGRPTRGRTGGSDQHPLIEVRTTPASPTHHAPGPASTAQPTPFLISSER